MGDFKNLTNEKAIAKLKELAEDIKTCFFCTELTRLPVNSRPMSCLEVDEKGNLWFISSSESDKNIEILEDNRVQLFFSETSKYHFLSVFGHVTIYHDRVKIEEIWTPVAKAWFEQGKEDPKVTVIKVSPSDAYYWDTKDGKIVALFKMAAAAITGAAGRHDDGGVEGNIKV